MERRKGSQIPTESLSLPYEVTKGNEAVELYNSTGKTAQEWQELLLYDILAVNDEGLWVHTKYGYSIPRRNGKSEILAMRELWGLVNGEKILHTAHRTSTSSGAWRLLCDLLEKAGYKEKEHFKTLKRFGLETINMKDGGEIHFRTRSSKGGLGEGFDLLIIDEAQEYTSDQESALKYVVTSSMNPQTLFCGTPPTMVSAGEVFPRMRNSCLEGTSKNSGWAEWSVEFQSDPNDIELWYLTNPSLGTIFTERSVSDEVGSDDVDFNIQRLGLWIQYNQKSAISRNEWEALAIDGLPGFANKDIFVGIKFGKDGTNASMSVAVKTVDGKIFTEAIDCRPIREGVGWMLDYLIPMNARAIVVDGQNGQILLNEALRTAGIKRAILPTVAEVIQANAFFEQAIFQGNICHCNQTSLTQSISNCQHRQIGSNGGFGFKSIKSTIDSTLIDATALAVWLCNESKEKKKQKVSY